VDRPGRVDELDPERLAHVLSECGLAALRIQRQRAAGEERRIEIAEEQVGVGDRRLFAAQSVARRSRIRAGRVRTDAQGTTRIDPGDAAPTGADLGEIDRGNLDRHPGSLASAAEAARAADVEVVGDVGPTVTHDTRFRGRAPHVERDDIAPTDVAADVLGRDHSRGGPGLDRVHRPPGRERGRHDAAARAHDVDGRRDARVAQSALEVDEVSLHHRAHVGRHQGGRGSLVLAKLGPDLRGRHDREVRQRRPGQARHPSLVVGVRVRVQEADRNRLHPEPADLLEHRAGGDIVERFVFAPVGKDPTRNLEAARRRNRWLAGVEEEVEARLFDAGVPSEGQHRAEPSGRHERYGDATAFEDHVRGQRRGVGDTRDGAGRGSRPLEHVGDAAQQPRGGIVRGRQVLAGRDLTVGADEHDVGEGSADVDPQQDVPGRRRAHPFAPPRPPP
jgi:hypothetical protein